MIGGFNTNVRYRGRTFHVQTEDSGPSRPHIVTLVYEGGTILHSKKQKYEDPKKCGTDVIRDRMEGQHRDVVLELRGGLLDEALGIETASGVLELGDGVISERRLDELIVEHLLAT